MTRRRITLRQLETFAEVARQGSFTRAADALHLTQPAVSIQVRQIADTLGLPLFVQNGRDVALTAAGDELLIAIANPNAGQSQHAAGNHIAVANIRERLALYYDLEARLEIEAGEQFYEVRIILPCRKPNP